MRKLLFRSRSGEGYPMVIAVTLCLLMLFMPSGFLRELKWQKIHLFSYTIHVFGELPNHRYPIQSGQILLGLGLLGPFHG